MFKKTIVGVDEHHGGRDAIALARNLRAPDGKLTLAYVYAGDPHVYRSTSAAYEASERERGLELLDSAAKQAQIDADLACVASPSVGRGLHELAESQAADLLVLGSCRRGLLGRVLIGDDTRAALNGAPCAVAIAPGRYRQEPTAIREVGVGYDGSPESERALELARRLTTDLGAKLSAFQAVSVPVTGFAPCSFPPTDAIEALLDDARGRIAVLGGVEPHATYGEAAQELAVYSASLDLLIVGSRGYGPIGRLIHGSTSAQLARLARCPLLVLPRAARMPERPDAAKPSRAPTTEVAA
jgi:nucleotide-binding universal stress UspA family protein